MKKTKHFFGIFIIISLSVTVISHIFLPGYRDPIFVFMIGIFMCINATSIMINSYLCKIKVSAVLTDYGFEHFKAHITSSPVFSYQHQGKAYTESCRELLSQRYVLKHYKEGQIYDIYISIKDPTVIKLTRRIRMFELLLFFVGLCLVFLPFYLLFL